MKKKRKRIKVRDPETGEVYLTNVMNYKIDLGIGNYPPRVEPPKDEEKRKIWSREPTMDPKYAKIIKRSLESSLESYGYEVGIGQYFRSEITPNVTKIFGDPSKGIHTCNVEIAKSVRLNPKLCKSVIDGLVYAVDNLEKAIKWEEMLLIRVPPIFYPL